MYQVKKFKCKKCLIEFDVESDSSIKDQDYCNECNKDKNK